MNIVEFIEQYVREHRGTEALFYFLYEEGILLMEKDILSTYEVGGALAVKDKILDSELGSILIDLDRSYGNGTALDAIRVFINDTDVSNTEAIDIDRFLGVVRRNVKFINLQGQCEIFNNYIKNIIEDDSVIRELLVYNVNLEVYQVKSIIEKIGHAIDFVNFLKLGMPKEDFLSILKRFFYEKYSGRNDETEHMTTALFSDLFSQPINYNVYKEQGIEMFCAVVSRFLDGMVLHHKYGPEEGQRIHKTRDLNYYLHGIPAEPVKEKPVSGIDKDMFPVNEKSKEFIVDFIYDRMPQSMKTSDKVESVSDYIKANI